MNAAAEKPKRGLGRGLDALFADGEQRLEAGNRKLDIAVSNESSSLQPPTSQAQRKLPITALIPAPSQPRQYFDPGEMQALSESIMQYGVLQPLLVRPSAKQNGKYEIIAGERRWRASQIAALHEVPVIVQDLDDRAAFEIALIENVQRSDLTPIEEAEGYQKLISEFGHTQEALGDIVGKSRSHMTNTLRLLTLPKNIRDLVHQRKMTAGHARSLIGFPENEMNALAKEIINGGMSVREIEQRRQQLSGKAAKPRDYVLGTMKSAARDKSPDVIALEKEMGNLLGLKVEIDSRDNASGRVAIGFTSLDQLDELLRKLSRAAKA